MIKLIDILHEIESNKVLIPRRSEERKKKHVDVVNKKIQQYIKDGGKGDLNLFGTPITLLPNNLKVGGDLELGHTPLSKKFTSEEIKQIIKDKGGYVKGEILGGKAIE